MSTLYVRCREQPDRTSESECVYHRQSECQKRGKRGRPIDPSGFDAGKRVKGKKRHVLVDTLGLLLHALVHPANVQDRDGGILLLSALADRFPLLEKLFADGAYQGPVFGKALAKVRPQLTVEIVKRSDPAHRFCRSTETVDCGAHDRVAQSLSSVGQGFREPYSRMRSRLFSSPPFG